MSDQSVNISISTTGAPGAAADVQKVGTKIEQLGKQTVTTTGQTKNWGMATSAMSYQMQDFAVQVGSGTSALTDFAQQAPQLIGGLSMAGVMTGGVSIAMSALAVAIPIALFGGKALWSSFSSGADDARKKTDALADRLKDVSKIYKEFEDAAKDAREEEAKADEERSRRAKSERDIDFKIRSDATALQGTIATLNAQLELSRARLDLARIESALTVATGEDALRLSKERGDVINLIYGTELKIQQVVRDTALEKLRDAKERAQIELENQKQNSAKISGQYEYASARAEDLEAKRLAIQNRELENEIAGKLFEALAKLEEMQQEAARQGGLRGGADMGAIDRQKDLAKELERQFKEADKSNLQRLGDATAERDAAAKTARETKEKFEAAENSVADFAKALTEATIAISATKRTHAAEENIGGQIKAADAMGKIGANVTGAAKQAIGLVPGGAPKSNDGFPGFEAGGFPGMDSPQEVASQLNGLITDNKPDAGQAKEILALVESLKTTLGGKDATVLVSLNSITTSLTSTVKEYEAIKDRLKTVEDKIKQSH